MIPWKRTALAAALTLAAAAPSNAQDPDPAEQLAELQDEYQEAYDAYVEAYRAAESDEARRAARELRPDPAEFVPRFVALAGAHPKTQVACDALVWVANNTRGEEYEKAVEVLVADHLDRDAVGMVLLRTGYGPAEEAVLARLERARSESASRVVQGQATFALAKLLKDQASEAEGAAKDALQERYVKLMERVVAEYAELPAYRGTLGEAAGGELFELRHLQVGMLAPDIEAEDLDGVPFKLSDYRGKVVLLDFWGHW